MRPVVLRLALLINIYLLVKYSNLAGPAPSHQAPTPKSNMSSSLPALQQQELSACAARLSASGRGLLAADESTSTIGKRFEKAGIANVEVCEVSQLYLEWLCPCSGSVGAG